MTQATRLIVDTRQASAPYPDFLGSGAAGYVVDASRHDPAAFPDTCTVAIAGDPSRHETWMARPGTMWLVDSLNDAIRLRDRHPSLTVLPTVTVGKASTMYRCGEAYPGEGFRVFVPDTATLRGYQVSDRDLALVEWLNQAISSGFDSVWLVAADAETRGRGYDLEALDRARPAFPGNLWLSGGPRTLVQIERLRKEGGTHATVLPAALLETLGVAEVVTALGHPSQENQPVMEPQVA